MSLSDLKVTSVLTSDPLILYSSLGLTILVSIVLYVKHKHGFWERHGVKGPKPTFIFGHSLDLFTRSPLVTHKEYFEKHGKVVGIYTGLQPALLTMEPEMIKDILVRDFSNFTNRSRFGKSGNQILDHFLVELDGAEWKRMRSVMSPTFTSGKMKSMFELMDACCQPLKETLKRASQSGDSINAKHVFGCYTMDVIAKCCFATETNAHCDPDNVFVRKAREFFGGFGTGLSLRLLVRLYLPPFLKKVTFTTTRNASLDFFEELTKALIKKRKEEGVKGRDYLQLLIDAGKEITGQDDSVTDNESHHGYEDKNDLKNNTIVNPEKRSLSDIEIVSNAVLFLFVGYETTGTLLTYSSYSLALNPDVQERLYQEVKSAYEQKGNKFDYETISSLKYLDAFVSEVLRMYPAVISVVRKSAEDYKFALNGITIPKGSQTHIAIYAMHHCEDFFPEPEKFDPTRFLPENRHKIIPFSYVPFSGGPRNCIGMRFALLEAKLALANLVLNFKFRESPKTVVPLDFSQARILLSVKEVFIGVQERSQ